MEDRLQRAAVEDQIANFGQTPIQLFRKKHPRRGAPIPISRPLFYAPASITLTSSLPASVLIPSGADKADKGISLLYVGLVDGKVVVITSELKIIVRNWVTASQAGGNFTFSSSQVVNHFLHLRISHSELCLLIYPGFCRSRFMALVQRYPQLTRSRHLLLKVWS